MEVLAGAAASIAGLDFSKNLSYFAIPAAWVCAHAPHLFAIIGTGKTFNNMRPRAFKDDIANSKSLSAERKEFFLRVKSASDNGYETLGLFAAAVVAANQAGLETRTLNTMAWGYIASRLVYNYVYIFLGGKLSTSLLRPVVWTGTVLIALSMFVSAGRKAVKDA